MCVSGLDKLVAPAGFKEIWRSNYFRGLSCQSDVSLFYRFYCIVEYPPCDRENDSGNSASAITVLRVVRPSKHLPDMSNSVRLMVITM
jgi:hypothetical protein